MERRLPRHLLNDDGSCFDDLAALVAEFDGLSTAARYAYRGANATAIAGSSSSRLLVVAGPGSGKTHLFLARMAFWLPQDESRRVYVATFVRKLVNDLRAEVQAKLPDDQRSRVTVSTLHTLARSLLERSQGTQAWPMRAYIRVVDSTWAGVVWDDVLMFHPGNAHLGDDDLRLQLDTGEYDEDGDWPALCDTYRRLCQFYNAVGFGYMIVFAQEAVAEQADLSEHELWIIDEYQDFNSAEDHLIRTLIERADGVLLAGDDEQALYQDLKSSTPDIIIGHYRDIGFAKAMLPFCSRCGYYICNAASAFIARHRSAAAIDKIYLPLKVDVEAPKVQVVVTAAPTSAVDYVRKFLEDHEQEFQEYLVRREAGEDTDPFLLILSPTGGLTLRKADPAETQLRDLVASYSSPVTTRSNDYRRVVAYQTAERHVNDNFAVRKVLAYENIPVEEVHELIVEAMKRGTSLGALLNERRSPVLNKMRQVAQAVDRASSDPAGAATDLAALLGLRHVAALAAELAEFPIRHDARAQEDDEAIETAGAIPPVALMTMIGSKGLSSHHVVVLGCDNVNMASTPALTFFVALTRARSSLHLVVSRKAGGAKVPHQFVYDLPPEACDYGVYKKASRKVERLDSPSALRKRVEQWARMEQRGRDRGAHR